MGSKATRNPDRKPAEKLPSTVNPKQVHALLWASCLSVLIAVTVSLKPLTPFLNALAIIPFFVAAMRRRDEGAAARIMVRWVLATFISVAVVSVFVPDRAEKSIPFARSVLDASIDWITGENPGGTHTPAELSLAMAAFAVSSIISGGVLALLIGSVALCSSAYGVSQVMRHGDNIFHVALLGVPPWLSCFAASATLLLIPTSRLVLGRLAATTSKTSTRSYKSRSHALLGVGLFLLSLALRIALGATWRAFLARCTVF